MRYKPSVTLAQPQFPAYPQPPAPPPAPPRRNTALIVAILVSSLVLAATAIGITVAVLSDGESSGQGGQAAEGRAGGAADGAATSQGAMKLPPVCELFTDTQLRMWVPGQVDVLNSEGPIVEERVTWSECVWRNVDNGFDVPTTMLNLKVYSYAEEASAKEWAEESPSCTEESSFPVAGADFACTAHTVTDENGAPVDSVDLVARHKGLLVEVRYSQDELRIDQVDSVAADIAATVIGTVVQQQ